MTALVFRHLKLYFRNKSNVFFSILGALIAFVLYLVFLQKNLETSWKQIPNSQLLLDLWVMGGVLAVTGITTAWTGAAKIVVDKERQVWDDFILTDLSPFKIQLSYLLSASLIALVMQAFLFAVMAAYFSWQDGLTIPLALYPQLLLVAVISAVSAALLSVIIVQFLSSTEAEGRLGTIIGTASGFLVGVYVPIGVLPTMAQNMIKFVPGAYVASLYRQLLMTEKLDSLNIPLAEFKELMGIGLKLEHLTTEADTYKILVLVIGLEALILLAVVLTKTAKKV
ncbi:ABC transporter permease [Streptococcus ferus]|uniref:ABC transporter permease n=1 Tax=Streptococcus ferus TaxID=1345 RepID=UPI00351935F8